MFIVLLTGSEGIFGHGPSHMHAMADFRQNIRGGTHSMQAHMMRRAVVQEIVDPDVASEIAECVDAPWF